MKAVEVTPPAVDGLVITGAAITPVPVRLARVDDPPLSKRKFAALAPMDSGEKRTVPVQVAMLATMPTQVLDKT